VARRTVSQAASRQSGIFPAANPIGVFGDDRFSVDGCFSSGTNDVRSRGYRTNGRYRRSALCGRAKGTPKVAAFQKPPRQPPPLHERRALWGAAPQVPLHRRSPNDANRSVTRGHRTEPTTAVGHSSYSAVAKAAPEIAALQRPPPPRSRCMNAEPFGARRHRLQFDKPPGQVAKALVVG
jgi:hypothetical protein